jgi:Leucine Rich repeat
LSHNKLGDQSAKYFAYLLKRADNKLVKLDISDNLVTSKGLTEIQVLLDDLPRLKTLKADLNLGIPHAQHMAIKNTLDRNRRTARESFVPKTV